MTAVDTRAGDVVRRQPLRFAANVLPAAWLAAATVGAVSAGGALFGGLLTARGFEATGTVVAVVAALLLGGTLWFTYRLVRVSAGQGGV